MFRVRNLALLAAFAAAPVLASACGQSTEADAAAGTAASSDAATDDDASFAELQARGEIGMGVDQYESTHIFDSLDDGGRIEFQYDSDDAEAIATVRSHLKEIQEAFSQGDFSIPAFVHARGHVPGTEVMAVHRDRIDYSFRELPRGGELRLITTDPVALAAIHEFIAFQRDDHRAGGMDHGSMHHGGMDHEAMDGEGMHHGPMHHGPMDRGSMTERHMMMGGGMMGGADEAFAADMDLIHELLTNHRAITRTVEHLPAGIRTLTESESPAVAGAIIAHVASMERRLEAGEVFNLFSHTLPAIFENYHRIESSFEYLPTGVAVVQTSSDPALVEALQGHAAEVTEMVDEGMIAMMRGMGGMRGGMRSGGVHQGGIHRPGAAHGHGSPPGGGTL